MKRSVFRKAVALAGVVVAMLGGALAQPGAADTSGTPNPTPVAKVGTGSVPAPTLAPPGPLAGLVEGMNVRVHVDAGSGSTIAGVNVRLCKPNLDITQTSDFFPTQGGNCIPSAFVSGRDDSFVQKASVSPNTSVDVDFRVGSGSKTFTWAGGTQTSTITCNFANPCALWLDLNVPAQDTSDSSGHIWRHYDVTYRNIAVADFDGNGSTDVSVFRPSSGTWFMQDHPGVAFGLNGDIPVPCDYDGNGTADVAVFRPSTGAWYIGNNPPVYFGLTGDIPVPGDYNGDGLCDIALFRPSTGAWFINGQPTVFLGISGDLPVPGDYNGDGTTDIAVFRPSAGGWYLNGKPTVFWGLPGDIPVPGDYNGDGITDIAVYRPDVGGWYLNGASTTFFGAPGDVPVPGDYDGNGSTDIALFRPGSGLWFVDGGLSTAFGQPGDIVLPLSPGSRQALT